MLERTDIVMFALDVIFALVALPIVAPIFLVERGHLSLISGLISRPVTEFEVYCGVFVAATTWLFLFVCSMRLLLWIKGVE